MHAIRPVSLGSQLPSASPAWPTAGDDGSCDPTPPGRPQGSYPGLCDHRGNLKLGSYLILSQMVHLGVQIEPYSLFPSPSLLLVLMRTILFYPCLFVFSSSPKFCLRNRKLQEIREGFSQHGFSSCVDIEWTGLD